MTTMLARPVRTGRLRAEQIAQCRAALLEQRAFRVEQLVQLQYPDGLGPFGHGDAEIHASLQKAARHALHDVCQALWRIDDGTYGLCTSCGTELGLERLEIVPQTALCIPCRRAADALKRAAG